MNNFTPVNKKVLNKNKTNKVLLMLTVFLLVFLVGFTAYITVTQKKIFRGKAETIKCKDITKQSECHGCQDNNQGCHWLTAQDKCEAKDDNACTGGSPNYGPCAPGYSININCFDHNLTNCRHGQLCTIPVYDCTPNGTGSCTNISGTQEGRESCQDSPICAREESPTATNTPRPTRTPTPTPTGIITNTPTPTPTGVITNSPTPTPTDIPETETPVPTLTHTPTPTATTPPGQPTNTPGPTLTPVPVLCGTKDCDDATNPCRSGYICVQAHDGSNYCTSADFADACKANPSYNSCCTAPGAPTATPTEILLAKTSPTETAKLLQTGVIQSFVYIIPAIIMLLGLIL